MLLVDNSYLCLVCIGQKVTMGFVMAILDLPETSCQRTSPILGTMLASQCSRAIKSMDNTLSSLQGYVVEATGPLSKLMEAINDDGP